MMHDNMILHEEQRVYMSCEECSLYGEGCEKTCPYEISQEEASRPSRAKTRRAMKVEKTQEEKRAKVALSAILAKERQRKENRPDWDKIWKKAARAQKKLDKAQEHHERRMKKHK